VAPRCWPASAGNFVTLVTRNPALKTVGDFGPGDRIAVPSVKQGPHSILLGIALEQQFGPGSWNKRDFIQVRMGHNDGALAVLTPSSQVNSHFSTLRNCPEALRETRFGY
jgi:NitT/TauT family transport system substrate-binding protein